MKWYKQRLCSYYLDVFVNSCMCVHVYLCACVCVYACICVCMHVCAFELYVYCLMCECVQEREVPHGGRGSCIQGSYPSRSKQQDPAGSKIAHGQTNNWPLNVTLGTLASTTSIFVLPLAACFVFVHQTNFPASCYSPVPSLHPHIPTHTHTHTQRTLTSWFIPHQTSVCCY